MAELKLNSSTGIRIPDDSNDLPIPNMTPISDHSKRDDIMSTSVKTPQRAPKSSGRVPTKASASAASKTATKPAHVAIPTLVTPSTMRKQKRKSGSGVRGNAASMQESPTGKSSKKSKAPSAPGSSKKRASAKKPSARQATATKRPSKIPTKRNSRRPASSAKSFRRRSAFLSAMAAASATTALYCHLSVELKETSRLLLPAMLAPSADTTEGAAPLKKQRPVIKIFKNNKNSKGDEGPARRRKVKIPGVRKLGEKVRGVGRFLRNAVDKESDALFL